MKFNWQSIIWMIGGLLVAGVIYLVASPPRGESISLQSPPTPAPMMVHVVGAVSQPGLYSLPSQSRVQDAIDAAGGLTSNANPLALNLAGYLTDGEQLIIPTIVPTASPTETIIEFQSDSPESIRSEPPPPPGSTSSNGLININIASQEELELLPGVGPVTAGKIIAYRESNGGFQTIEEILEVSGIGPVKFEGIKGLITVGDTP